MNEVPITTFKDKQFKPKIFKNIWITNFIKLIVHKQQPENSEY